jgi:protoheme IX farnesyltransferase
MIRALFRLFRLRLAVLNGISALGGYLLFPGEPAVVPMAASLCGVALLAAGGSAINQVQERGIDRLMVRTRLRPLPCGDLTPLTASGIGGLCILAGLMTLAAAGSLLSANIGAAALILYLAVYTPLKRRTPFALAIGALCGAFPPVIGWVIAGGVLSDFRVILLAGLFYLWQVPHFWLFQRKHADDYRCAGIMQFRVRMKGTASAGLCRLWIVALVAGAMLLPAFGIIGSHVAFWYAAFPCALLLMSRVRSEDVLSSVLNMFPLLVTLALVFQR